MADLCFISFPSSSFENLLWNWFITFQKLSNIGDHYFRNNFNQQGKLLLEMKKLRFSHSAPHLISKRFHILCQRVVHAHNCNFRREKGFERTASQIGWIVKTFNVQQKKNREKKETRSTQGGHRLGSIVSNSNGDSAWSYPQIPTTFKINPVVHSINQKDQFLPKSTLKVM